MRIYLCNIVCSMYPHDGAYLIFKSLLRWCINASLGIAFPSSNKRHLLGIVCNSPFKGQCHEILCLWFFHESNSPQPQRIPLGPFRIFLKIRGRNSQVKVHHRYQRYRWQTIGTWSDCWQLKMDLKKKMYQYANSTNQRCPKEIMKTFLMYDFFHLPPVSMTLVVHLELRIYPRIFNKIRIALMV